MPSTDASTDGVSFIEAEPPVEGVEKRWRAMIAAEKVDHEAVSNARRDREQAPRWARAAVENEALGMGRG